MRSVVIALVALLFAQADDVVKPDRLLQRGKESYRAARYEAAVEDLRAAASQLVGEEEKKVYIETGNLPTLPQFEEAVLYLALANSKLGREADARDAVERLLSAERISPVYKTLTLDSDAAEFEPLAAKLVPGVALSANVAAERTALARAVQEQGPAAGEAALPPVMPKPPKKIPVVVQKAEPLVTTLRRAQSAAVKGSESEATRLFVQVATAPNASRDAIASAATGLYRVSDYSDAVDAFTRLGTFARGEEDLRYYDAVSLYEVGRYDEARHQLACALPYLEASEDVTRYRAKIEQASLR